MLAELLFAERAPLYKKLVITEQKVETLSGSADAHVDPNLFTVLARIKKPGDVGYVEKSIHDEIARIAREGVDDKTLARGALAREVRLRRPALDRRQDRLHRLVVHRAHRRPRLDQRLLRALRQGDQRRRQARRRHLLPPTNRTVVTLKAGK